MSINYTNLALNIVKEIGGEENIIVVEHCMTRLRFELKDSNLANKEALNELEGIIEVMESAGQYQVIIGNHVGDVYDALLKHTNIKPYGSVEENKEPEKKEKFDFLNLVSSIFLPAMGAFIGASVIKGLLVLLTSLHMLDDQGSTYVFLNAIGDSFYYFLPIFLAITSAKRFQANSWVSVAIAGTLCYPTITGLVGSEGITLFGVPVSVITYTSSVFPIIAAVFAQSKLEKLLNRCIPKMLQNIITPALTMIVICSMTFIIIGPITDTLGTLLMTGIMKVMEFSPLLAGFIAGVLGPIEVIFGLHWAMLPIVLNNFATLGYDFFSPLTLAFTFVVTGATLAVFLKTKDQKLKEVSLSACIVSMIGGITEPGIYGVLLKYKRCFVIACIVNGLGGAFVAMSSIHVTAIPSLNIITAPAYIAMCGTPMLIYFIAMPVLGFLATYFFGFHDHMIEEKG